MPVSILLYQVWNIHELLMRNFFVTNSIGITLILNHNYTHNTNLT